MIPLLHPAVLPCEDGPYMFVDINAGAEVGWPGVASVLRTDAVASLLGPRRYFTPPDGILRCEQVDDLPSMYSRTTRCTYVVPAPAGPPKAVNVTTTERSRLVYLSYECGVATEDPPVVEWAFRSDQPDWAREGGTPYMVRYPVAGRAPEPKPAWLGNAHADAARRHLAAAAATLDTCGPARCSDEVTRWREAIAAVLASEAWNEVDRRPIRTGAGTRLPRAGVGVLFDTGVASTTVYRSCTKGDSTECEAELRVYDSQPLVYRYHEESQQEEVSWANGRVSFRPSHDALQVEGDAIRLRER